ncbi:MAG: peptide deformylase [Euryarchaeota archaeon]|nr:peptide deformylase [Euryarchaeota archaeon]|tara:strand:+ start:12267 stop:12776 length:510 start_codon:yes stop_codon:yes gene_type:complete
MPKLQILIFPDPRLRTVAKSVVKFDETLEKLTQDMLEAMYDGEGIGLAATQVNIHKRIIVIDVTDEKSQPIVLINPIKIEASKQKLSTYAEGCLSVPGFFEEIERPDFIKISHLDVKGEKHILKAEGILAIVIQHEMDHLDGKVFVDYLSNLKRERIRTKLNKIKKGKR